MTARRIYTEVATLVVICQNNVLTQPLLFYIQKIYLLTCFMFDHQTLNYFLQTTLEGTALLARCMPH